MKKTDLDPSLAFTALLELDGENRTMVEAQEMREQLLEAYYAQNEIRNLWDFTKSWLDNRK